MKRLPTLLAFLLPILSLMVACNEDSDIGASIVQDQINITVDSAFTITGKVVDIDSVQSRTTSQLIGCIEAKGFGRLSSDVVTQFMPSSTLDTANINASDIDSLILTMYVSKGEFVGDSVAPLGLTVYQLNRTLPSPIYSNFDPKDYYSPKDVLGSTIYNLSDNTNGANSDGSTHIRVKLPIELARNLYTSYLRNPNAFNSPTTFANIFPGVYIKNSYGSGRFCRVTSTIMSMHYHYNTVTDEGNDSTLYGTGNYFAVTPEIITNNNIHLSISDDIRAKVAQGENIVLAPAGLEVQIKFPAREIIDRYKSGNSAVRVLNSVNFSIPGESIENDYNISAPQYLLLVLTKNKESFFAKNTLPDNITSFYATYSSTTGLYDFGDMRQYILDLMAKDEITDEDITFSITPVSATYETSSSTSSSSYYYYYYYYGSSTTTSTLSMLTPYVAAPVMGRLLLDKAKIKLTFASQSIAK